MDKPKRCLEITSWGCSPRPPRSRSLLVNVYETRQSAPFRGADWRVSYTFTNSDRLRGGRGLQPQDVISKHLFGLSINQRYRPLLFSFDLNRTGSYVAPVFENDFPFRTAELTFPGFTK